MYMFIFSEPCTSLFTLKTKFMPVSLMSVVIFPVSLKYDIKVHLIISEPVNQQAFVPKQAVGARSQIQRVASLKVKNTSLAHACICTVSVCVSVCL